MDAQGTCGYPEGGPSTVDVLAEQSPLPRHVVAEECRRFLHTRPQLTEALIEDVCGALLIPRRQWPVWPRRRFAVFPGIREALARLECGVTICSNLSVTQGPHLMRSLTQSLHPWVEDVVASYQVGLRKPDPRLWQAVADAHGVDPAEIVHIGNQWTNDILGAVTAGCRAILLNGKRLPAAHEWPTDSADRIAIAGSLADLVPLVHSFAQRPARQHRSAARRMSPDRKKW